MVVGQYYDVALVSLLVPKIGDFCAKMLVDSPVHL
jgi:hypothetical protein